MLYDEGDECTDITGGWSNNGFLDYSFQKNTTSFSLTSVIQGRRYGLITNNIIDLRKYSSSFMVAKRTDTTLEGGLTTWVGSSKSFNHDGVMYNGLSIQGVTKSGWIPIKTTNTLCISTYLYNDALFSTINSGYFGIENYANVSNSNLNLNIIHIGLL